MRKLFLLAVFLCSISAWGQSPPPDCSSGFCAGVGAPAFACKAGNKYSQLDAPGTGWSCTGIPPHWVQDAGGGGSLPAATYAGQIPTSTGAGNAYTAATAQCSTVITDATHVCITAPPYYASNTGLTTTTTSATFGVGTSGSVASCSTFSANQGVLITGAGAAAANYVGTVVSCNGTTLTVTPATSTSVASGVVVQHDESAAFQAGVTALGSVGGGTIYAPDGVYLLNGPLQDTSGANAIVQMPKVLYGGGGGIEVPITISGFEPAVGGPNPNSGAILQTSASTGNLFGGYNAASTTFGPFTSVRFGLRYLTLRGPNNPGIEMANAKWITEIDWEHLRCDTTTDTLGANTAGVCFEAPSLSSGVTVILDDIQTTGFYTDYILGEHAHARRISAVNGHNCLVPDIRGAAANGNTVEVDMYWTQSCVNSIAAGTTATTIDIEAMDSEATTGNGIYDPSNILTGHVNWNVPYAAGSVTRSNLNTNGATGLQLNNLHYGDLKIPPSATSGQNGTISFMGNFGADAIDLYAVGSNRYGWGLLAGEMQFFLQDNTTTHYSFNAASGGLQASGSNEYMRLTPRAAADILSLTSAGVYAWSTSASNSGAGNDTGLSRSAANTIACGNGTQGNATCTFKAATVTASTLVQTASYTVAGLPSASTSGAGAIVRVTDASTFTVGACTGGGSDTMLAVSDGAAWTCH